MRKFINISSIIVLIIVSCTLSSTAQDLEQQLLTKIEQYSAQNNLLKAADNINKLAFYYWENNTYEKAVYYFEKSVAINLELGNKNAVKGIYSNIGMIYSDMLQPESSIVFFRKSLLISREQNKKGDIGTNLMNIAVALESLERNEEALKNLEEALPFVSEMKDKRLLRSCYGIMAEVYEKLGNNSKSMEYFSLYSSFQKQIQREEVEAEKKQAELKVSKMQQEANMANAQTKKTEAKLNITRDSLKISEEENEKQRLKIQVQKLDIEMQEAVVKNQRLLIGIFIGGLISLATLAIIVLRSYQQKKRHNILLENRNQEIREKSETIEKKNLKINQSINYAKNIQGALLPEMEMFEEMFPESFIFFSPRDVVSGDFYWFSPLPNNKKLIAAIDCTGHGVPGAFMSMLGMSFLEEIVIDKKVTEPVQILEQMHVMIKTALKQDKTENSDGMDMALCVFDETKKEIQFAGAVNPMVYIQDNEMHVAKADFFGIGGLMKGEERKFVQQTIKVDKPTTCYIYSDGFADQFGGENGRKYFSKNFRQLLFDIHKMPMIEQKLYLKQKLEEWHGDKFLRLDDVLIMGFRIN